MKNVIVAQSGGPTAVINSSLLGVFEGCQAYPGKFGRVFAAHHGVEGILREEVIDLCEQPPQEMSLLRTTPAAGAIGTSRYKIRPDEAEDLSRIVEVFQAHEVGYFFYIGGNDSMDTAQRVSHIARTRGMDLTCVGVPKTIDNDLGDAELLVMDHTPGYGSVARYWAELALGLEEENRGSWPADPVLVVQAMGRRIGFVAASARLADPDRQLPLMIVLPEADLTLTELGDRIDCTLRQSGRCIVIVGEGLDAGADGGGTRDAFGHVQFGTSEQSTSQALVNYLNKRGLPVRGCARGQVPGTAQRHSISHASPLDIAEAYEVGRHAVDVALRMGSGYTVTIRRITTTPYEVEYGHATLDYMANSERKFPASWITPSRIDVTDDFINYARPLIGESSVSIPMEKGLPRFARLQISHVPKKCPKYTPQAHRRVVD